MKIFDLLMFPSNFACKALGVTDENERSVVRMLINALLWTSLGVIAVFVVFR